jgi:hypothetical protein
MTTNDTTGRSLRFLDHGAYASLFSQAFAINDAGSAVGVSVLDGRSRCSVRIRREWHHRSRARGPSRSRRGDQRRRHGLRHPGRGG